MSRDFTGYTQRIQTFPIEVTKQTAAVVLWLIPMWSHLYVESKKEKRKTKTTEKVASAEYLKTMNQFFFF